MAGKPKDASVRERINNTPRMTIELAGDGSIISITGGGHSNVMTSAEFDFQNYYLDCEDIGAERLTKILDMKSYTFIVTEVTDKKTGISKVENYIWESSRHWW